MGTRTWRMTAPGVRRGRAAGARRRSRRVERGPGWADTPSWTVDGCIVTSCDGDGCISGGSDMTGATGHVTPGFISTDGRTPEQGGVTTPERAIHLQVSTIEAYNISNRTF